MFSGFFSGSKAPSPPNTANNSSSNGYTEAKPVPPPQAAAPPASSSDIFGGMEVTSAKSRRAKARQSMAPGDMMAVPTDPSSASKEASFAGDDASPTPSHGVTEAQPIGRKKRGVTAASSEAWAEIEKKAKIRSRLERFYTQYNPSKLDSMDKAMASYEGREDEMFEALTKKYGPEPPAPAETKTETSKVTSPLADDFGSGGAGGGGGWGTSAEDAATSGGWGDSTGAQV
eukprot:PhF_6_TR26595/c0_g1_i2/m.38488